MSDVAKFSLDVYGDPAAPCGCILRLTGLNAEVVHCPLHGAAGDMLQLLHYLHAFPTAQTAHERAEEIIKRAEGRS